jgi:hypothetical protein
VQVQHRLVVRLVASDSSCNASASSRAGAEAFLLVGGRILGIIDPAAPVWRVFRFNVHGPNHATFRRDTVAVLWASFSDFCRIVANGDSAHPNTGKFADSGRPSHQETICLCGTLTI